jgi:hypothetical protein
MEDVPDPLLFFDQPHFLSTMGNRTGQPHGVRQTVRTVDLGTGTVDLSLTWPTRQNANGRKWIRAGFSKKPYRRFFPAPWYEDIRGSGRVFSPPSQKNTPGMAGGGGAGYRPSEIADGTRTDYTPRHA